MKDSAPVWEEEIKRDAENCLYLMDFDAYPYGTMSLSEVLNNPAKSMGHGFVLAMLLTVKRCSIAGVRASVVLKCMP